MKEYTVMTKEEIIKLRQTWESIYLLVKETFGEKEINHQFGGDYNHLSEYNFQIIKLHKIFEYWTGGNFSKSQYKSLGYIWTTMMILFDDNKDEALDLMERKRKKYGNKPLNLTGQIGLIVRQIAKLCRLENLEKLKEDEYDDESVIDTRRDIFNYCIIGIQMFIEEGYNIEHIINFEEMKYKNEEI